ncbi:hypothetical protein BSO21_15840, partial [Paenibacillus odorifer]
SPGKSGERPAAQGRVWRPERLLPCGIAAREPGQERCDQLRKVAHWRPERLLPCEIAAREPGQER